MQAYTLSRDARKESISYGLMILLHANMVKKYYKLEW